MEVIANPAFIFVEIMFGMKITLTCLIFRKISSLNSTIIYSIDNKMCIDSFKLENGIGRSLSLLPQMSSQGIGKLKMYR